MDTGLDFGVVLEDDIGLFTADFKDAFESALLRGEGAAFAPWDWVE